MTTTNMPYPGLKIKGRNKRETKLSFTHRHNKMIHTINCWRYVAHQAHTDVKQPLLPYGELDLCNDYILKDPEYIDCFCINFLCHCVLKQVHLGTNLIYNMVLRKEGIRPTKEPRSEGPHKSKPEETTSTYKNTPKNKKFRSVSTHLPGKPRSAKI